MLTEVLDGLSVDACLDLERVIWCVILSACDFSRWEPVDAAVVWRQLDELTNPRDDLFWCLMCTVTTDGLM